ncbi:gamma-glutamyl-gamma-aminobutyrate hydrolase family protein [Pelosinus propionicus]|uniref:Putative glutamine amidotransferase n=1 Tax=Pelosinus propionicus DSM 13327 TaxID=1123291 RepID=A0A1I4I451_9FIRM|nr:gamma-glutamyl-gamma-aminobutyrate hydrolase family protein [Pelosinus propionicus]SFL48887.1 putative glutamine amidotransferase [Pelosinus propionicus DSM 13327]
MTIPIVGISASMLITEDGSCLGNEQAYVNKYYVKALAAVGAAPLLLPIVEKNDLLIRAQLRQVDCLLLSGGYDINPLLYGEEPLPELEYIMPERDEYEVKLIQMALEMNKPILGICRGMQILNVACGGTLYQDLNQFSLKHFKHQQKSKTDTASHTVEFIPNTKLHRIMGVDTTKINTFYHQAIKDTAPNFIINGKAKDGIIEGIEKTGENFVMGVQWHPEMMMEKDVSMLKIFQSFIGFVKQL